MTTTRLRRFKPLTGQGPCPGATCGPEPWLLLARVSTASRAELIEHIDTAMAAHSMCPHVAAIHKLAGTPGMLDKGAAGIAARCAVGWKTVYAPGTAREIGVLAEQGHVRVLFLNASAASRDLGDDNAFLAVMQEQLADSWFRGTKPHAPAAERPKLLAPFFDRLLRDLEIGLTLFRAVRDAHAVVIIDGTSELDSLADGAEDRWMMEAWASSKSRQTSTKRLAAGSLNLWRLGRYAAAEAQLCRGYRFQHEELADGTWRRSCDVIWTATGCDSLIAHVPEPDPEQWWQVEVLIDVALDPEVRTWVSLGRALGAAGLVSRDSRERGTGLDQVSDVASAAKTAIGLDKLDAYAAGRYTYRQIGPGSGTWTLPGGHRFQPRHDGDTRGVIEYAVELGLPTWPSRVTPERIQQVRDKWWPAGKARPVPAGAAGRDQKSRPLSGLLAWEGEQDRAGYRFEVLFHSGRWELRSQNVSTARRLDSGALADLRHNNSQLVLSWSERELTSHVADLIDEAVQTLLCERPDAVFAPAVSPPRPRAIADSASAQSARRRKELQKAIDKATRQSTGANEASNDLYASGRREAGLRKLEEAERHEQEAAKLTAELEALKVESGPDEYVVPPIASPALMDVGHPAGIVAALRGAWGAGTCPPVLKHRLSALLNGTCRILPTGDGLHALLTATVRFDVDGGPVDVTRSRVIAARHAAGSRVDRDHAAARAYMYLGHSQADVARAARRNDDESLLRTIRQHLQTLGLAAPTAAGAARDQGSGSRWLAAAVRAAVPEPRHVVWSAIVGEPVTAVLPEGYAQHVLAAYADRANGSGDAGLRWARGESERLKALVVLTSHPTLSLGMQVDHLTASIGFTDDRAVLRMSTVSASRTGTLPATIARVGGWGGVQARDLTAGDKLVAPQACPHTGCAGVADALVAVPEVTTTGSWLLCSTCRRPPTSTQRFPESYLAWARQQTQAHTGSWVPCARQGCLVDFGPGPGLVWRWDPDAGPVWHSSSCAAGREPATGPAVRLRRCAAPVCQRDEGCGAGVIANSGRANRAWHDKNCINAGRLRDAAEPSARRCGFAKCSVDEGQGPGVLVPGRGRKSSRVWHDRRCQIAAARLARGRPDLGTVTWAQCGWSGCTINEGGGIGQVGHREGQTGRPRRFHDATCGRRGRTAGS